MMMGRIDEVDGHFIATRFVAMIFPAESVYISSSARSSRPDTDPRRTGSRLIVPIRLDWQSVGLAYTRVWLPLVALLIPVVQLVLGVFSVATWFFSVMMIAAGFTALRLGRLSDASKARLRVLGTVTGLRIDPSKLKEGTRTVKRDSLGDLMDKAGIPLPASEILAVLEDIPPPALPLVYGFARYAGDDPEWRTCAEAVFARYEAGEI